MIRGRFLPLALLLLLLLVADAPGQQPKQPPPAPAKRDTNQEQAERVEIRRVRLPITVTDKHNRFVSGLSQGDFLVFEDKVPQQIETFTNEQNNKQPLYVAVLMDTSP